MSSEYIAKYRNKAGECFAHAKTTKDSELKALWLALAERWDLLAEFVEKTQGQPPMEDRDGRSQNKGRPGNGIANSF